MSQASQQYTASQSFFGKRPREFATFRGGFKKVKVTPRSAMKSTARSVSNVRKIVAKEILKRTEKKIYVTSVINQAVTTASGSIPTGIYLGPLLTQGSADNARVGNRIDVQSAEFVMYFNLLPYNATTNYNVPPVWVKIFIVRYKPRNTSNGANVTWQTDFFQNNGTSQGFNGNTQDLVLGVNEEQYECLETRVFKLGVSNAGTTGPASSGAWCDNSPSAQQVVFDLTKHMKGSWEYNDNANVASNRNLWMVVQAVNADGSNSGGLNICEFHSGLQVKFIDP